MTRTNKCYARILRVPKHLKNWRFLELLRSPFPRVKLFSDSLHRSAHGCLPVKFTGKWVSHSPTCIRKKWCFYCDTLRPCFHKFPLSCTNSLMMRKGPYCARYDTLETQIYQNIIIRRWGLPMPKHGSTKFTNSCVIFRCSKNFEFYELSYKPQWRGTSPKVLKCQIL